MRESAIEQFFRKEVEKHGGLCYKWVSPGNIGVPDRIVFFNGICHLVELKSTGGRLSVQQIRQHLRLAKLGFDVCVISSKEQARTWVELNASIAAKMNFHDYETKW